MKVVGASRARNSLTVSVSSTSDGSFASSGDAWPATPVGPGPAGTRAIAIRYVSPSLVRCFSAARARRVGS